MPIRMEDDPAERDDSGYDDQSGGGGRGPILPTGPGGGGGGLFSLLPMLLGLFRGKGIFILLLIAVGAYFFLGREGCGGLMNNIGNLATGGFLDPREFEKASIYEPLAEDNSRNPLPESANLQRFAPRPGNQGRQGSCVAWSSAYAARSILESARTGRNEIAFSPAFLYNQIGMQGCEGSYLVRAMEFMTRQGSVPYDRFPYDETDCSTQPNMSLIQEASNYKMRGFNRLSDGDRTDAINIRAIRENLAQGAPVVIGMMVGQSFMQEMMGKDVWMPTPGDQQMMGFGGHAMCVVGYDDKRYGGAFLIMNSWGPEWGNNGFAWIRYPEFKYFVREAYGLEPMTKAGEIAKAPLRCEIGLVQVSFDGNKMNTGSYIPLRKQNGNRFETTSPVRIGSKFKIEIRNTNECFIYLFGRETDGSCYVLFPYPMREDPKRSKYSPFCGITGYRLFPRDKSMTPDSIGNRDMVAFAVSREPLDWSKLNQAVNSQLGSADYPTRVRNAVGREAATDVMFSTSEKGNIIFTSQAEGGKIVYGIVEIDKQ